MIDGEKEDPYSGRALVVGEIRFTFAWMFYSIIILYTFVFLPVILGIIAAICNCVAGDALVTNKRQFSREFKEVLKSYKTFN